ncbi:MAG: hypothetical protein HYR94_21010, partial [Chloroflexi bacterium]|nr:hypothetical protein [Chloroflexota bacterium]
LYAQAMVEGDRIALGLAGHILADPHLDAVDIMVHLPHFYPNHYPLSEEDINDIVAGHSLEGIIVDLMDEFFIIQHLSKLYHLAAGWLNTSQLEYFISGDKCVYPALAVSF